MEILFTKKEGEKSILLCKRKDGSSTWRHIILFFITHDLCHFAVEKILQLKNAFYGMVASGIDINDFDLPKEERKFSISDEAIFAEHLVNLLTIEYMQGKIENFMEVFKDIYEQHSSTPGLHVLLTGEKLNNIRKYLNELITNWQSLPVNQSMILTFEE